MELEEGERLEDLECNGLKIIQNKNLYTFTSDSVLLANFIKLYAKENCVEIGAGSGVISILLSAKNKFNKIIAFELQKEMADLADKNIELNSLKDKIEIVNDDIGNFKKYLGSGSADCVFSNPPYMSTSGENKNRARDIARHDSTLSMDKLCKCANNLLKEGGRFYVIYGGERSCVLISELIKNRLEPKRMFFTSNGKGEVKRVVIEAVKGGRHGVKVLPELVTNDKDGNYLELLHTKYF